MTTSPSRGSRGFTLIELLVVLAVIVASIGVVLPAVQKIRDAVNHARCVNNLKQIGLGMHSYAEAHGRFPDSLSAMLAAGGIAEPAKDGFQFVASTIEPDHVVLLAEPIAGVTGLRTGVLDLDRPRKKTFLIFVAGPNGTSGSARMFEEVMRAGAEGIAMLTGLMPLADQERAHRSTLGVLAEPTPDVHALLRTLAAEDGTFSFKSFHSGTINFAMADGSVRFIVDHVRVQIEQAMQLGARGEDWMTIPGTTLPELASIPPVIFNWSDLAALTQAYVSDPELERELLGLVRQAQQAEQLGEPQQKEQALQRFFALVDRSRGTRLPAVQADVLLQIGRSL